MPARQKRIRRQPDDARRLILDAAEASMGAAGPAGLRLQDVAKAAGVSHPTILHHFGSREGLVRALNLRMVDDLKSALLRTMEPDGNGKDGIALSFAAYRAGLAQRMVWLLQTDTPPPAGGMRAFEDIVAALHATRLRHARAGVTIALDDTRAIVHLTTIAAFGDALIGPRLRQTSGAKERAAREQFERWLSALIGRHIMAGVNPASARNNAT